MRLNPFRRREPPPRIAAASPMHPGWRRAQKRLRQPWQIRAAFFAQNLGAVRFASGISADACARCTLTIERNVDPRGDVWEPVEDNGILADLLRSYRGKRETQRELVRLHAWLQETVGEAFQFIEPSADGRKTWWNIRSPLSVEWQGAGVLVRDLDGGTERDGTARLVPYELGRRLWIPNETWPALAISPLHGVMEDCERYWSLAKRVRREVDSALLMQGILWTPSEAHVELAREEIGPGGPSQPGSRLEQDFYQVAQRAFEESDSVEAMAPMIMHYANDLQAPHLIEMGKPLDPNGIAYRTEALEAIGRGLNYPQRLLVEGTGDGNHWCTDETTEILTRDGWVTHDGLAVGDDVLTLDHETGLSEWQPVSAVNRFDVVDEPMVSIEGRYHSSLTTLNHRWPTLRPKARELRHWRTSETLTDADYLVRAAPHFDLPIDPKHSDAFVEMVGWFFTEGECHRRPGRLVPRVTISQSHAKNPGNVARIRAALESLYGPPSGDLGRGGRAGPGVGNRDPLPRWRIDEKTETITTFRLNARAAAPLLAVAPDKIVGVGFVHSLTAAQLELFIETAARADGSFTGNDGRLVMQSNPARLRALEVAAILSGRSTVLTERGPGGFGKTSIWWLAMTQGAVFGPHARNVSRQLYTGTVWCPTTANRTWLARRNGRTFYTGNSDWLLKEDFAKESIAPKMERIAWGDLTETFLRPGLRALCARSLFDEDPEEYRIGFDMTPIVVHPDQSKTALELYQLGVLSDTELLSVSGFDASAAPDRAELGRWIVRTQIMHETVRAPLDPGQTLPGDASTVLEQTPATNPTDLSVNPTPPALAALDAASTIRETVSVGPFATEAIGWLDD